jgi:hypothetical protein
MVHDDSDLSHQLAARITKLRERYAKDEGAYQIAVAQLLEGTAQTDAERASAQRMLVGALVPSKTTYRFAVAFLLRSGEVVLARSR